MRTTLDPETLAFVKKLHGIGVSEGYAYDIATTRRTPSDKMAIRIWRELGLKLGTIAEATDDEIVSLERLKGLASNEAEAPPG